MNVNNEGKKSVIGNVVFGVLAVGAVCTTIYLLMCWWGIGYRNARTPAGYMGYVTQGSIFGKSRFIDVQGGDGPTSTGMGWLMNTTNVSVNPYTYVEEFAAKNKEAVQAKDSTSIEFSVAIKLRVRPTKESVRQFVEHYTTLKPGDSSDAVFGTAYGNYLKQPLRTKARQEIEHLAPFAIKDNMKVIGTNLKKEMEKIAEGTPFEVLEVTFGYLHLPETVTDSVADSIVRNELLAQKDTEIKIQEAEAAKRVIEAEALAEAMAIIKKKLTVRYLRHQAIEVQLSTVTSPNQTTTVIPVGPLGVPVVTVPDAKKEDPKPGEVQKTDAPPAK